MKMNTMIFHKYKYECVCDKCSISKFEFESSTDYNIRAAPVTKEIPEGWSIVINTTTAPGVSALVYCPMCTKKHK